MSATASASVLVVGGSRLTAALLSRDLGPRTAVPTSRTAEQALERILLDLSIIAVVSDLTLAGMSGAAFLARLRASPSMRLRELPFVALGGNDDPHSAMALVNAGANAYVAKLQASRELASTLRALLPGHFDNPTPLAESNLHGCAATRNGARVIMPIASVLRLRWNSLSTRNKAEPIAQIAVNDQIRHAFERRLRACDRWRPDADGHGGVLGLTCPVEDSLRPLLRLATNLTDAASRLDRVVSVSMMLETAQATGTIDFNNAQRRVDALSLPAAGEVTVVLPSAQFRLKLDREGPS